MSKLPAILLTPVPVTLSTPVVVRFPAATLPVTASEVNVPTLVIFGCAAVVTVPAVVAAPLSAPVNVVALTLPALILPVTANEPNVPTLVILGCAAVVTVPAVVALVAAPLNAPTNVVAVIELFDKLAVSPVLVSSATLPVAAFAKTRKLFPVPAATLILSATLAYATFKLDTRVVLVTVNGAVPVVTFEINRLAVTLPLEFSAVNVPTLVMLGCAAVVTVPAVVAAPLSAPVNVVALTLPALTLPVTAKLVSVPVLVIFG